MAKTIAIVEDDADQRAKYDDAIARNGYQVEAYGSRAEALRGFAERLPDLAILDIVLGEEVDAGFQLCRDILARTPTLPVIFLTERIDEIDKISGLRLGAWDYLPKPISLAYLAERIASLLRIGEVRAAGAEGSASARRLGDLVLDQDALIVSWKGERIDLSGFGRGAMLLVTWYDGLGSWQASRSPPAAARERFARRGELAASTVAYATRLIV